MKTTNNGRLLFFFNQHISNDSILNYIIKLSVHFIALLICFLICIYAHFTKYTCKFKNIPHPYPSRKQLPLLTGLDDWMASLT